MCLVIKVIAYETCQILTKIKKIEVWKQAIKYRFLFKIKL